MQFYNSIYKSVSNPIVNICNEKYILKPKKAIYFVYTTLYKYRDFKIKEKQDELFRIEQS